MGIAEIIALIAEGANALRIANEAYQEIKSTVSEEDQAKIDQNLADAQAASDAMRSQVDAVLSAASEK